MESQIEKIKEYRKVHKQCVSTSHLMTIDSFLCTLLDLRRIYKEYTVEFRKDEVRLTIPTKVHHNLKKYSK